MIFLGIIFTMMIRMAKTEKLVVDILEYVFIGKIAVLLFHVRSSWRPPFLRRPHVLEVRTSVRFSDL